MASAGSQNGRAASSNAGILAAIQGNGVSVRQNSGSDGAGRAGTTPTRPTTDAGTTPSPAATPKFTSMQQNWLDANTGAHANVMKGVLGRTTPFQMSGVDVKWANFSNGKAEFAQRAVGTISDADGKELAALMGGTLVKSPFEIFGSPQRDQYIRMPNGQMIDASRLASQLNAARSAEDPFAATQSVLDVYKTEAQQFNLMASTDAIDLVTKGVLRTGLPT